MLKHTDEGNKYIGSVKVGAKGQVVIPKEIRDMFNIKPGDNLLFLADSNNGIAIERSSVFAKIADAILSGNARDIYPDKSEKDSLNFAKKIKEITSDSRGEDI